MGTRLDEVVDADWGLPLVSLELNSKLTGVGTSQAKDTVDSRGSRPGVVPKRVSVWKIQISIRLELVYFKSTISDRQAKVLFRKEEAEVRAGVNRIAGHKVHLQLTWLGHGTCMLVSCSSMATTPETYLHRVRQRINVRCLSLHECLHNSWWAIGEQSPLGKSNRENDEVRDQVRPERKAPPPSLFWGYFKV